VVVYDSKTSGWSSELGILFESVLKETHMDKLVIDRTLWLRGEGSGDSYLRRERDGKQCCLGFYCLAQGLSEETITGRSTLAWIPGFTWEDAEHADLTPLVDMGVELDDSDLCNELTCANDTKKLTDAEREAAIIAGFSRMGVVVEFIN
jgi:hypothetical protein